jgi:EpsI family protein
VSSLQRYGPAGILCLGCALVLNARLQTAVPLRKPLALVMAAVPGHQVIAQTLSEDEARVAGMTSYVARKYVKDSLTAFTTLVSYYDRQMQGHTIHSPKNCLPGAGWEVIAASTRPVSAGGEKRMVNRYVLKNGNAIALTYYWYQGRGRVTANEYAVKWNLLRDATTLGHTEEALVRVVVPVRADSGTTLESELSMRLADSTASAVSSRLMLEVADVLPR